MVFFDWVGHMEEEHMVLHFPCEIDYQKMVLKMMMIHHILVFEMISIKGWDGFANLDCTFHLMGYWGWTCEMC